MLKILHFILVHFIVFHLEAKRNIGGLPEILSVDLSIALNMLIDCKVKFSNLHKNYFINNEKNN